MSFFSWLVFPLRPISICRRNSFNVLKTPVLELCVAVQSFTVFICFHWSLLVCVLFFHRTKVLFFYGDVFACFKRTSSLPQDHIGIILSSASFIVLKPFIFGYLIHLNWLFKMGVHFRLFPIWYFIKGHPELIIKNTHCCAVSSLT